MNTVFPFYSETPESSGYRLYHTHPRCRVAQGIADAERVPGTGEGRRECPFCFLLSQFQANRGLRGKLPSQPAQGTVPNCDNGAAMSRPERSFHV